MTRLAAVAVLLCACGTTVTRARTEDTARAVVAETAKAKAESSVNTAKRVHRVTVSTKKPTGEVVTVTTTDIGVDVKAGSSTTAESSRASTLESTGKSDITTKTHGWKWFASIGLGLVALLVVGWFLGRRLLHLYL